MARHNGTLIWTIVPGRIPSISILTGSTLPNPVVTLKIVDKGTTRGGWFLSGTNPIIPSIWWETFALVFPALAHMRLSWHSVPVAVKVTERILGVLLQNHQNQKEASLKNHLGISAQPVQPERLSIICRNSCKERSVVLPVGKPRESHAFKCSFR
jgi:hypothetical protein